MRIAGGSRTLAALVAAAVVSACGGGAIAPELPAVAVATGAQVLRVGFLSQCSGLEARTVAPLVYARVTVSRNNAEWIARASSPDAGDVEVHFHASGPSLVAGSMPVQGSIKGEAVNSPDLGLPGFPTSTRVAFGSDGRTSLDGFAFGQTTLTPSAGISGFGSGTVTFSDNDGHSCGGSSFTWSLAPPPG